MWMDVETCGLGQNDYDTKNANKRLFTGDFRIHPKISETGFEVSTPSVGTIKQWSSISWGTVIFRCGSGLLFHAAL